ncbi:hypothetical protein, partial [Ralstonia pseudosolanacearum]|uniref:hypothetical protein n=1 Tax=Ralstonia pseudosolanacearum TaxID=1310165 RepID=UPI002963333B
MAQYAPVGIGCNGLSLGMSLGGVGTIGGGDAAGGAAAGAAGAGVYGAAGAGAGGACLLYTSDAADDT